MNQPGDITPGTDAGADSQETLLENGRLLFAKEATFLLGAANLSQVPDGPLPEQSQDVTVSAPEAAT